MSENMKVWTLVVSDSEGLVGVSVWTSAEAAQQSLATYAAEVAADDGEDPAGLEIRWEKGAIEYGSTEEAWTGYFEYADESYSLVQQPVLDGTEA